jgi:hypothetical protein
MPSGRFREDRTAKDPGALDSVASWGFEEHVGPDEERNVQGVSHHGGDSSTPDPGGHVGRQVETQLHGSLVRAVGREDIECGPHAFDPCSAHPQSPDVIDAQARPPPIPRVRSRRARAHSSRRFRSELGRLTSRAFRLPRRSPRKSRKRPGRNQDSTPSDVLDPSRPSRPHSPGGPPSLQGR